MATERALFGAGCFWGVEEDFRQMAGVVSTAVGYAGGTLPNPSYEQVCTGRTGHAEVVEVTFDPAQITFETLLETFFKLHDPTQINGQGPDLGTQYRSVIFPASAEQKSLAESLITDKNAGGHYRLRIATKIEPAAEFYRAEEYHQQYVAKRNAKRIG